MEIIDETCAVTEQSPVIIKKEKDGNSSSRNLDVKANEDVSDSDQSITWEVVEKKIECIDLISDEEKGEDEGKSLKKDILHENVQIKESSFPLPTTAPATTVSSKSSSCSSLSEKQTLDNFMTNIRISYDVEFLKELQNSPLAQTDPKNLPIIPSFTSRKKRKKRSNIKHIVENTEKKLPPKSNVVCELCGALLGSKKARRSHNRMHNKEKQKLKQLKECTANEKSSLLNISSNLHNSSVDSNSHSRIQTSLNVNLKSDPSKKETPATRLRFCEVCQASFKNRKQLNSHLYITGHCKQSYKLFDKEREVEKFHSRVRQYPSDPPLIQPFVSVPLYNMLDSNFVGDPRDYRLLGDHFRSSQLDNRVTDRFGLLHNPHHIGPLGSSRNKHYADSFNYHSRNLVSHSNKPPTGTNQRESHVTNKGRIHKCLVCSEMFSDKKQFLNHKKVHKKEKKENQQKKKEMEQFFSGKCREEIMERHIAKFISNIRRQVEHHKLDVSLDNFMASKKLKLSCDDKERGISNSTTDKISGSEKVKHVESCSLNTIQESRKDSFISETYKSSESYNTVKNNISDQQMDAKLICFIDTSKESTKIERNAFVTDKDKSNDTCILGGNDNNKQPLDAKLNRCIDLSNESNRREKNSFIKETDRNSKTRGVVKKFYGKKSIDSGSKCSVNTSNNFREVGKESFIVETDKIGETTCSMGKNNNEQPVECTINSLEPNMDENSYNIHTLDDTNLKQNMDKNSNNIQTLNDTLNSLEQNIDENSYNIHTLDDTNLKQNMDKNSNNIQTLNDTLNSLEQNMGENSYNIHTLDDTNLKQNMDKNSNNIQTLNDTLNSLEQNMDENINNIHILEDMLNSLEQKKSILATKQTSPRSKKRKASSENSVTFDVLNNSKKPKTELLNVNLADSVQKESKQNIIGSLNSTVKNKFNSLKEETILISSKINKAIKETQPNEAFGKSMLVSDPFHDLPWK
nr:uncharacterized protein PF11_0213 isoform X2 [Parasteatoda tepidariorum]